MTKWTVELDKVEVGNDVPCDFHGMDPKVALALLSARLSERVGSAMCQTCRDMLTDACLSAIKRSRRAS